MKTEELIELLRGHQIPEKIDRMERYMRNKFQFLGLQAGERRQLTKEFLKDKGAATKTRASEARADQSVIDWEMLFLLWELPEREFQLVGII